MSLEYVRNGATIDVGTFCRHHTQTHTRLRELACRRSPTASTAERNQPCTKQQSTYYYFTCRSERDIAPSKQTGLPRTNMRVCRRRASSTAPWSLNKHGKYTILRILQVVSAHRPQSSGPSLNFAHRQLREAPNILITRRRVQHFASIVDPLPIGNSRIII